jgi:DGQHR domain-containing protein
MNSRLIGEIVKSKVSCVTVTPPCARDLFFVSTYDSEDPQSNAENKHGYQRPPSPSRFAEIANYFQQNGNAHLITPLIVSVRLGEAKDIERFLTFLQAGDTAAIKANFGSKIASIVDGQHRNFGLIKAWEEDNDFMPEIPVLIYFGLSFIEEAELFNTINVTQRKLPKALIETTKGDIIEAGDSTYAQKIRRISFSLCREADSVWGPVNGVELRRSTANMFTPTLLMRLEAIDEGLPMKYAKRYWRSVAEACQEGWNSNPATREEVDQLTGEKQTVKIQYRIKDLVGVASLAKLGKDIITSDLESKEPKKLEDLTGRLVEVDWEKREDNPWMRSQAGFAGQKDLYEMLHGLVYSDLRPGEPIKLNEELAQAA